MAATDRETQEGKEKDVERENRATTEITMFSRDQGIIRKAVAGNREGQRNTKTLDGTEVLKAEIKLEFIDDDEAGGSTVTGNRARDLMRIKRSVRQKPTKGEALARL